MKYRLNILAVLMLLAAAVLPILSTPTIANAQSPVKAFPGAAGFGTDTPGGRGGQVIYVSNLNDSGDGSLRAALEAKGPRTVLFSVAGKITLSDDINITSPYLTVAGQTAPGEGVQIRGAQIKIKSHDIIIRYIKVRSGDQGASNPDDRDAIANNDESEVYNIVIDHSTLIWGSDIGGVTFLNGSRDSTVSYSILGEGLYVSRHKEGTEALGGHSMSMNITELSSSKHPTRITVHHNLLTTSSDRNPRIIGGESIDFVNNVIYNWQQSPSQGNPRSLNLVNNYYIAGPMTNKPEFQVAWLPRAEAGGSLRGGTVFESGNAVEGITTVRGKPQSVYTGSPFQPYSMGGMEQSAGEAYSSVLAFAGAHKQVAGADGTIVDIRDDVDTRIINNLAARTGTFQNGVDFDGAAGFPAISWPELAPGTPAVDGDLDGMPDAWEQANFGGLGYGASSDSSSDFDGDGYTDLEEYLNGTNPLQ